MEQIKISIIISCYNLGQYLGEALGSIVGHVQDDCEIIIVNDGSTAPETIAALADIAAKYKDIRIIDQANTGLGKARNNGIKAAKGKYILPLDADNKLRPEFLRQSITILDENPDVDVVYGNAEFFGNKTGLWQVKPFDILEMVLNNYIDACACFRKKTWENAGGYDEEMPVMGFEDWDLWLRMSVQGSHFQYIDKVFFDYRVRDNSMLSGAWDKRQLVIDYIFGKKDLQHLSALRNCLLENRKLKAEPAFGVLLQQFLKKIKRKF